MENTREKVAIVVATLRQAGIACHLFGGWAEEILGLRARSTHGDIDLLYCGEDFKAFDRALHGLSRFEEVPLKRFRHKRAFQFLGTLCEITLVQGPEERPMTLFGVTFRTHGRALFGMGFSSKFAVSRFRSSPP